MKGLSLKDVAELYRCVILTLIAIVLFLILLRTPIPFTLDNVTNNKVQREDIPIVAVSGGEINVR